MGSRVTYLYIRRKIDQAIEDGDVTQYQLGCDLLHFYDQGHYEEDHYADQERFRLRAFIADKLANK